MKIKENLTNNNENSPHREEVCSGVLNDSDGEEEPPGKCTLQSDPEEEPPVRRCSPG